MPEAIVREEEGEAQCGPVLVHLLGPGCDTDRGRGTSSGPPASCSDRAAPGLGTQRKGRRQVLCASRDGGRATSEGGLDPKKAERQ